MPFSKRKWRWPFKDELPGHVTLQTDHYFSWWMKPSNFKSINFFFLTGWTEFYEMFVNWSTFYYRCQSDYHYTLAWLLFFGSPVFYFLIIPIIHTNWCNGPQNLINKKNKKMTLNMLKLSIPQPFCWCPIIYKFAFICSFKMCSLPLQ